MIDLYTWGTPNGRKVSIMLEECGLKYNTHAINIGKNIDQFTPEFVAINPNSKIPAITDSEGPDGKPINMFESGAILMYLSGKTGKFLPQSVRGKYEALQWLMFQMGPRADTAGVHAPLDRGPGWSPFVHQTRRLHRLGHRRQQNP